MHQGIAAGADEDFQVALLMSLNHQKSGRASTVVGLLSLWLAKRSQPKRKVKPPRSLRKNAHRHNRGRKKRSRLHIS